MLSLDDVVVRHISRDTRKVKNFIKIKVPLTLMLIFNFVSQYLFVNFVFEEKRLLPKAFLTIIVPKVVGTCEK